MTGTAPMIDHKDLYSSAEAMEALPITVGRLATIVASGDHDVREIVEVVSLDQALTATLLRRANSAASSASVEIKTVRDAAVRLGTSSLLSMALAASISGRMNRALPAYGLAEGQLWKQSVAASLAAEVVRAKATVGVPFEASTAALLHDFGKIVLSNHFGPQVLDMVTRAAQVDDMNLLQAEQAVFGLTHADIGGVVAQRWKLPHTIVDAVIHHHHTGRDQTPISAAVSLAHAMVPEVIADLSGDTDPAAVPDAGPMHEWTCSPTESHAEVFSVLGIDPDRYPELVATVRTKYADLAARYHVT